MLSENAVNAVKKNSYKYGTNSKYLENYLKFSKMQDVTIFKLCYNFLLDFCFKIFSCLKYINKDRYELNSSEKSVNTESFTSNLEYDHTNEKVVYKNLMQNYNHVYDL